MRRFVTHLTGFLACLAPLAAGSWGGGHTGCVQIQHEFSPFENAPGSLNYQRAEAVKVRDYIDTSCVVKGHD
jgi:hypothetical protein